MGKYEDLVFDCDVPVIETDKLPSVYNGYYIDGQIFIKEDLPTQIKHEVLAEELAHHKLTYGNITDQSIFNNRKFENYARRYAMEQVVTLGGIVQAFSYNCNNLYEMSNFFEVSEEYIKETLKHYKKKYGLSTQHGDYVINFEPLRVFKYINFENKGEM